ncbi:hypothetical protein DPV83_07415 [Aggregatibacter segnis]|uniref:Uncharacterized protein n=1 Tax=Aggregatibacter segnis TaxID=739 RepID=A0A8B2TZH9_9PAST|nr:hypothetical protein DPV83_07415 [Aggregatibacter segnis]
MPIPLTADLLISKILHLFYLTHPKGTLQCLKHSTAQHSTAQHSTAQHSTAQHSTAQHSTWITYPLN